MKDRHCLCERKTVMSSDKTQDLGFFKMFYEYMHDITLVCLTLSTSPRSPLANAFGKKKREKLQGK